ncbi:ogr/Delta-like zinc finger family protein [Superficieibacter sp. BNK-5]|uniref:ogr/Delta-like zinc finger family protein n=1 Tax=Superficieibacter sp. BNK-5 TaxID=3376142 RepID=UPI0039BF8659
MMHCPFCKSAAQTRTSRYLSEKVRQIYYQCTSVVCPASFRAMESVDKIIQSPADTDLAEDTFIVTESDKTRKQRFY